jgi:hypothetical protein
LSAYWLDVGAAIAATSVSPSPSKSTGRRIATE